MNKLFFIVGILMLICFKGYSQTSPNGDEDKLGMYFEHGISWQQILTKAKESNKFIFVDCYTTWCAPCKQMAETIFPLAPVGKFMNDHYINVGIQMDSTKKDNQEVISWYQTSKEFTKLYDIGMYPTYLIFSPDGTIVHKLAGTMDKNAFISKMNDVLNPENQYYTLQKKYDETHDPSLIGKYVRAAMEAGYGDKAKVVAKQFIKSISDPFTKENLLIIEGLTDKSSDIGYQLFLHNQAKIDNVLGVGEAKKFISNTIMYKEEIEPLMQLKLVDWHIVEKKITRKSNASIAKEWIVYGKVLYYSSQQLWKLYEYALMDWIRLDGNTIQPYLLNNMIWSEVVHGTNTKILTALLPWAKKSFEFDIKDCSGMDTYANLLYKLNRKEEAIKWENKALDVAVANKEQDEQKSALVTLQKMKAGNLTWN